MTNLQDKRLVLFVRKIPYDATDAQVEEFFSQIGPVRSCFTVKEKENSDKPQGQNKGFGFVRYALAEDAERAMCELKKVKFLGKRTLKLEYAVGKHEAKPVIGNRGKKRKFDKIDMETDDNNKRKNKSKPEFEGKDSNEDEDSEEEQQGINNDDNMNVDSEGASDSQSDVDIKSTKVATKHLQKDGEKTKKGSPSVSEGTTLFIRNLSFDATEEDVHRIFRPFGPLRYCLITMDHETGRSRGTGFVCFWEKQHADACLAEAEKFNSSISTTELSFLSKKSKRELGYKSILTADPSDSLATKFTLHGRVLSVTRAVEREEAKKIMDKNRIKKRQGDKRNLYLMREGVIFPDSPAAAGLNPATISKLVASYSQRKNILQKNPNLFISKTRLSIRNLPLSVDEKKLKELAKGSISKFKEDVKKGLRSPLQPEEMAEGWDHKPVVKQAKIVRSKDRIDAASRKQRSKGYGFVEFTQHAHALAALRYLNNNPELFNDKKRLTVEFAIENNLIVKKRTERLKHAETSKKVKE
ncbi:2741_t:CDS:2 [Paraglomus occultum]|uniref:2741_t:CDS:1 n=1 Tax=Paraglomus occultum TaxID=144539 RepID=A0A9N8VX10_9GLOM|nr:2741_t:CDS:2 [Paraglomus occultum]